MKLSQYTLLPWGLRTSYLHQLIFRTLSILWHDCHLKCKHAITCCLTQHKVSLSEWTLLTKRKLLNGVYAVTLSYLISSINHACKVRFMIGIIIFKLTASSSLLIPILKAHLRRSSKWKHLHNKIVFYTHSFHCQRGSFSKCRCYCIHTLKILMFSCHGNSCRMYREREKKEKVWLLLCWIFLKIRFCKVIQK